MRKAFNASKLMGLNRRKNETELGPYERSDTVDNLAVPDAQDTKSSGAHRFDGIENRANRMGGSGVSSGAANRSHDQYSDITEEMDDGQDDLASTYDSQEPEYEDEDESSYLDEEYDSDDDDYDEDYDTSTRPSGEHQNEGSSMPMRHENERTAYDRSGYSTSARPNDIARHHDKSLGTYGANTSSQLQSSNARRDSDDYTESSVYSEEDPSESGDRNGLDDEEEEDYASTYDGEPLDDDDEYIDDDDQSISSGHTVPADDNAMAAPYSSNKDRGGVSAVAADKAGDPGKRLDRDVSQVTSPSGQQSGGLLRGLRRRSTAPPPDAPTTRNALGAQRRGFLSRLQKIGNRRQPEQPTAKDPDMFRSNSIVGRSRGAVDDLEKRRSVLSTSSRTNARKDNAISMRDRAALAVTGGDHVETDKQDAGATIKEEPYVNYARPTKSLIAPGANDTRQAPQEANSSHAAPQSSQRPAEFTYVSSAEPFGASEQTTKPSNANKRGPASDYTSTSMTPSHHRDMAGSSADFSTYSDSDYVSTVGDSTRAMEAYDQGKTSTAAYNDRRGLSEGTTAATTSTNEGVLLRDETRGRMPQLVDPFSKGMSLGRFSRTIPRPESIEPSLFDVDRDSAQQSSPLLPASGPLSAQSSVPERIPSGASHNIRALDPVPAPPITAMSLAAPIDPTLDRLDVPKSQVADPSIGYNPSQQRRHGHSTNPSVATTASTDFQSARTPSSPGQGLQSPARISTRPSMKIASDLSPAERAKMPKASQGGRMLPGKRAAKRSISANADSLPPPVPPMPPMPNSQQAVPTVAETQRNRSEPLKQSKDNRMVDSILPEDIVQAKERALPPPPPPNFRGLEHKTAHRRRSSHGDANKRRLPLPKEPQNYLLTPSVAPTETDPEELAEAREQSQEPKTTRSWLLSDFSAEEVHYFLRAIVGQELDWELDRAFLLSSFDKPVGRSRSRSAPLDDGDSRRNDFLEDERTSVMELDEDDEEAVFRRDVYDSVASSETVDLPLLRFILKNAFCTFPLFVPPERRGGNQGRRPPPNKAAIARSFFFASILPILREWQARSLSAPIDRHGESDGTPFSGMSTTRAISMMLRKWTIKYITAVLRVGPGNPLFEADQAHNMGWPWPSAQLLPPEAYVSYRKPTDRLRLGGFEVDIVAVRVHSASERDFLLRIRRPNRLDEFVVRNDTDFEEFHAKLAQELGPFVHLRPLPRLPGRLPNRKPPMEGSATNSSRSYTSDQDTASYDYQDTEEDSVSNDTYDDQSRSTSYLTDDYSDDDDSQYSEETSTLRGGSSRGGGDRRAMYGARPRPPPLYETDRRLLRAWLRDTLAIRTISDSQEVRAFFSIGSFNDRELDTNELLNIAERRRGDCRRIEERERDAELAGDNVLGIRRVMHRIWLDCVDGDGFLKVFDALKTTKDFWELPMSYQTVVSWANLQIARFIYGIFVQGDESRANLARVRDMFDAIPWKKLANAMRLPASQMVGEWQKQFLRNRFLQTIFHIAFEDNPVAMDEDLRILQQSINSDTMIRKLRAYVESPEETKRLIRQHAERADIPLVAAIVRGSDHPKISKSEVQRVILATRAHSDFLKTNPTAAKKKSYNDPGYVLIVDLQRVLRLYSLHRDVTQIRGMLQDPTILDALTIFFEPLIDALVRLHRVRGIRQDILDLRAYLQRLFDLLESLRARIQDPARSINILAAFLDRGTPGWYNFLYRWSDADPVIFSTFAWLRHLAMTVGTGSEDLAGIWEPPLDLLEDPTPEPSMDDDVANMSTALRAASLAKLVAEGNNASSRPDAPPRLDETLVAEIRQLADAARRKRARQMEIACRWSAGDTEGDFSIQVFGDGTGKMRSEPFLPKEPRPAPKLTAIERLRKSFREAVSSALAR